MIITRTPLRVSLFGGGTDFPAFFMREGGCVLSTAIDKYIYVIVKERYDQMMRVGYTRTEMVNDVDEIQHELIREACKLTGVGRGLEIITMGDIPSEGSGLGSSSTVTVGTLHALYTHLGKLVSRKRLAREACKVEIGRLGKPIGMQDQFIAAYGGLCFINFAAGGEVTVQKVHIANEILHALDERLMLFDLGNTRQAESVLREQKREIGNHLKELRDMRRMANKALTLLQHGWLNEFGKLFDEAWNLKKELASGVSNPVIDMLYRKAVQAGALGGKVCGAGGGGFLLLYAHKENHSSIRNALGLQELPFRMETTGSKVIFEN